MGDIAWIIMQLKDNKRAKMALKRSPKVLPKSNLPLSDLFFNNHLEETFGIFGKEENVDNQT